MPKVFLELLTGEAYIWDIVGNEHSDADGRETVVLPRHAAMESTDAPLELPQSFFGVAVRTG